VTVLFAFVPVMIPATGASTARANSLDIATISSLGAAPPQKRLAEATPGDATIAHRLESSRRVSSPERTGICGSSSFRRATLRRLRHRVSGTASRQPRARRWARTTGRVRPSPTMNGARGRWRSVADHSQFQRRSPAKHRHERDDP